jgi:hypothetical protein
MNKTESLKEVNKLIDRIIIKGINEQNVDEYLRLIRIHKYLTAK